ncbi:MAG TPA: acetyl-CoA carboxylase biotin carboxyl carrier protein [Bacillaceae bacterium]
MLKIQEIREIIKLVDQSNIDEFVYEHEGSKIKMKKHANQQAPVKEIPVQTVQAPAPSVQATPVQTNAAPAPEAFPATPETTGAPAREEDPGLHKIISPMVGTFYQSPSPDSDVYVKPGSAVKADTVVCIVEAMKLFNEIEAEVEGEIVEVLVKDGQLVEYGQPLFLVKPR